MNIIGEGFPQEIVSQIDRRQLVQGSGWNSDRTQDQIKYLNANTSWVKLVSGVDIENQAIITDASLRTVTGIAGSNLAQQFVLFNGTVDQTGASINQREGIDTTASTLGNGRAYGIGGTEFGIRPMMGITSAEIKHKNRGSIRTATVKIKAFNKIQFEIIDVLYLRLGFSVLLEWGHSMYYTNGGTLVDNPTYLSLAKDFLNGGTTYASFLEKIRKQRIDKRGNYDAMFAKVCNFRWSLLPDGAYDITLELISIGDVMESFKINSLSNSNVFSTAVNSGVFDTLATFLDSRATPEFISSLKSGSSTTIGRFLQKVTLDLLKTGGFSFRIWPTKDSDYGGFVPGGLGPLGYVDAVGAEYTGTIGVQTYIRLGTLLKFIQDKILYVQSYKGGGSASATPILKIDTDLESNLMYVTNADYNVSGDPSQVSNDPRICMIRRKISNIPAWYMFTTIDEFIPDGEAFDSGLGSVVSSQGEYGYIMNIYVNIQFILNKLEELKNPEDNKVTLIDFLNTILSSITGALGGVNALEATIDETTNEVIIRDSNPFPEQDAILTRLGKSTNNALFSFIGYRGSGGRPIASFIKDFSFTTEISPALSTMITVGASANSTVVGEDSTAFSKFNNGLTDRYKESISDDPKDLDATAKAAKQALYQSKKDLEDKFQKLLVDYYNFLEELSKNKFDPQNNISGQDIVNNLITYRRQLRELDAKISGTNTSAPGTGFIPFNLSLTMDGLSGMKIYNKFLIDTDALPANYPKTSEFLIKNIVHRIENNKWNTVLESIVISKGGTAKSYSSPPSPTIKVAPLSSKNKVTITGRVKRK